MNSQPTIVLFYCFWILLSISCKEDTKGTRQEFLAPTGMVQVPGGVLDMGGDNAQADPNEYPKHKVSIDQ